MEAVEASSRPMIRALLESDVAAVHAIYTYYVLHSCATFEETPPSVDEMARRREEVLRHGLPYLAADVDGRVVGYAYASPFRTRSAYRFSIEDSLYVEHGATGRGIGKLLLATLIEECREGPWRQMIAVIADTSSDASIRLHEAFGFEAAGRLTGVGFKLDRWVDTVFMQLALK